MENGTGRELTPEEQAKVNRAQIIIWSVMAAFIVLPWIIFFLVKK